MIHLIIVASKHKQVVITIKEHLGAIKQTKVVKALLYYPKCWLLKALVLSFV